MLLYILNATLNIYFNYICIPIYALNVAVHLYTLNVNVCPYIYIKCSFITVYFLFATFTVFHSGEDLYFGYIGCDAV
jgi:hypothetical protein